MKHFLLTCFLGCYLFLGHNAQASNPGEGPFVEGQNLELRKERLWTAFCTDTEFFHDGHPYEVLGMVAGGASQTLEAMDANTLLHLEWEGGHWHFRMGQEANMLAPAGYVHLEVRPFRF